MAVVRKGESSPWSTDHAKWIFANRFFFAGKAIARGVNLKLRVDVNGRFRMVKKNTMSQIGRHPGSIGRCWAGREWIRTIDGAPLKRCQVKIVCLVLESSDPNYRTKQMEGGDIRSFGHESADRDSVPSAQPPSAHLRLFWRETKHQVLFSNETSHA